MKDLSVSQVVKISVLHVILLTMTVIGLKNHVTILPGVLEHARRDGWISVIIAFLIIMPWLYFIYRIHRNGGTPYTWSNSKSLYERIGIVLMVLLLLVLSASTMVEMLQWVKTTFLQNTPLMILLFLYLLLCVIFATTGLQTIMIVNVLVLFGVVVLGFFVAFVNMQYKDYELLLPILENGLVPPLQGVIYPLSGFVEILFFLLVQQHYKSTIKFHHFLVITLILAGLTLGPLIGAITEFGPEEASIMRYPAFEEWGLATLGNFINHVDFFSIYQWMTGAFVRIGFFLFIITQLMGISQNTKLIWRYLFVPLTVVCLSLLLLDEQIFLIFNNQNLPIITVAITMIMPIILYIRSKKTKPSK